MKLKVHLAAGVFAVVAGRAAVASASEPDCSHLRRDNLTSCALAASLSAKAEELGVESIDGRRRTASSLLPSNPSVALGGGYTIDPSLRPADREPIWSATLSQEVEIAGQRGRRLDVVSAERRAQQAKVVVARREAVAAAFVAWFDALAASEELRIADRLATLATALGAVSRARAEAGVGSDVEAQLADAMATRLLQARISAGQRVATTSAALATVVGRSPVEALPVAEGELVPLSVTAESAPAIVRVAVARRAEIGMALAEKEANEQRASLYERLRIPNPTVSVSVRNDWIGERTFGVGVAFPIPLPGSVGRSYAGEIEESNVLARRADTEAARMRRSVELEVATALGAVDSWKRQADLYTQEKVRKTEDTLRLIAQEIEARRLPVRDALQTQQALIDYLFASVEAKRRLCFASVELARAASALPERGVR